MNIQFLGATTTVTGSQFLVTTDRARVLVDCGMFQGTPAEVELNEQSFAFDPTTLDAVVLTHAHLDHCGLLPLLVKHGYRGPVFATRATVELARLVLLDAGRLQEEHAEERRERAERRARRRAREAAGLEAATTASAGAANGSVAIDPARAQGTAGPGSPALQARAGRPGRAPGGERPIAEEIPEPLYTEADAERCLEQFRPTEYDHPCDVAPGVRALYRDAGHILGSAIICLAVREGDGRERRIVFSGDVGRPNAPILRDPASIDVDVDYLLVESTYGGRVHAPEDEARQDLADTVRKVAAHGGVLLIPAFAIGRTQELVWMLDRLVEAGQVPRIPLYLDSPMASHASDIYRSFPECYDQPTSDLLAAGATPLDYPGQQVTTSVRQSKAIARAPRPHIIIASNGMLTGGRIVLHLARLVGDPRTTVLFAGYQAEGTLGAQLQAGERRVWIDGAQREVRCRTQSISGLSAHADDRELTDWLRGFARRPRPPRRVFVVHGEPEAREAVARHIRELGMEPHLPGPRETVPLD